MPFRTLIFCTGGMRLPPYACISVDASRRTRGGSRMNHFVALILLFLAVCVSWTPRVLSVSVVVSGPDAINRMKMPARSYLFASNYYLVMQPDCFLYLYSGSVVIGTTNWTESVPQGPQSTWGCYLDMQNDGNLVVYTFNGTNTISIWSSQTASNGFVRSSHRFLAVDAVRGKLNMYGGNGENLGMPSNLSQVSFSPNIANFSTLNLRYPFPPESEWKPNVSLDDYPYLPAEYYINQGSNLVTGDGKFNLSLGRDCKLQFLEIYAENKTAKQVIWKPVISNTLPVPSSCQLILKDDGKLQILNNQTGTVYWSTSPTGDNNVSWVLKLLSEGGGELVVLDILDSGNRLWSSIEKTSTATSWWPIVVGVLSGFFSLIVVGVAFWYFYARKRLLDPVDWAFQRKMQKAGFSQTLYSESRIKQATDNFGNKIGQGGFGDVFYGKLEDGQEIAAKVLSSTSCQSKQEFYNEIELLSTVHHKYLVSLLGYRCTRNRQILVYEYLGGGDLRQRLQGGDAKENPLTWKQRTSIILQVAEGLEYLHDKCCPSIIHRDVKSNNILLTNKLVAKVADFGLSKIRTLDQEEATHITTIVKGTPGYLDPEYHEKGMLTAKSDVYAYGIVLMEVLTGCNQMGIVHKVADAWVSENLEMLPDPNLQGDFDTHEFAKLVELSLWCSRIRNEERPFMRQVVQTIREIGLVLMETPRPEISFPEDRHFYIDVRGLEEITLSDSVPLSKSSFSVSSSHEMRPSIVRHSSR